MKKIKRAFISVYYKDGLEPIVRVLHGRGIEIVSTGGTATFIEKLGLPVVTAESITGYPSILDGRVKTLHPKIFGGILARQDNENDQAQMQQYEFGGIDLVIVDLYPFEATVASGLPDVDIIEKIDIGGISLIRAAAKNFNDVVVISSQSQYPVLLDMLEKQKGETTPEQRRDFARQAFGVSSHYDTAILNYFGGDPNCLKLSIQNSCSLR
ncbi:MAG: IMP cyclohydrolase [Desulfobulbaceae bacterium]|nr:IMP cyclohydrolase [Desulfobulbaceae bacterium]